jgi:hypothetical protein
MPSVEGPNSPHSDGQFFMQVQYPLMFSRVKRDASSLVRYVCLKGYHFGIVDIQGFPFKRVLETPIDHVAEPDHLPDLLLELWISFRVGVSRVRMTLGA